MIKGSPNIERCPYPVLNSNKSDDAWILLYCYLDLPDGSKCCQKNILNQNHAV